MLFPLRVTVREKSYVLTAAQPLSYRWKPKKIRQNCEKVN